MMHFSFFGGQGRNFDGAVNYMMSDDKSIYAEIQVPEGLSEYEADDYGYFTVKNAIIKEAREHGLDPDTFEFAYDSIDDSHFDKSAWAEDEVYVEIDD